MRTLGFSLALLLACGGMAAPPEKPHRMVPELAGHYACLTGNHLYRMIESEAELRAFAGELASGCRIDGKAWLAKAAKAHLDFEREVLLLTETFYGGTGMARASLDVSPPVKGVVTAAITITVPPPPVTPDVARFPFAFAVRREGVRRIDVKVGGQVVASLVPGEKGGKDAPQPE